MKRRMQAVQLMWSQARAVTCEKCGKDLKALGRGALPRLLRLGCPDCKSKQWTWDFPEEVRQQIAAIVEQR